MVGFARCVTDYSMMYYLADVIIDEKYRGQVLGKVLTKFITEHKIFKPLSVNVLAKIHQILSQTLTITVFDRASSEDLIYPYLNPCNHGNQIAHTQCTSGCSVYSHQ